MADATLRYEGEEVQVTFIADISFGDEGDSSIPNGTRACDSVENVTIDKLTILGVELTLAEIDALPERLQAAVLELADNLEVE